MSRVLEYPICIAVGLARGTQALDLELSDAGWGAVLRGHYELGLNQAVYFLKLHVTHPGRRCYYFYFPIDNTGLRE